MQNEAPVTRERRIQIVNEIIKEIAAKCHRFFYNEIMNEAIQYQEPQGNGVLPCVTTRFCFHSCKYLSITESEQNRLKVKDPHFCERYNKQVKHNGMHPRLPMLKECDYDNSEPRETRYELPPLQFF